MICPALALHYRSSPRMPLACRAFVFARNCIVATGWLSHHVEECPAQKSAIRRLQKAARKAYGIAARGGHVEHDPWFSPRGLCYLGAPEAGQ